VIEPPPADSVKGDEHLPWLQLNAYELALLRKRIKKNATWSPSDTMIARELKQLGRGIDNYRAAMAKAEAEGLDAAERIDSVEMPPPTARGSLKRPRAQLDLAKQLILTVMTNPSCLREAGSRQCAIRAA
jgi:hypothetical protein